MSKSELSITSHALDANVNVFIRVIDKKGRVAQEVSKHNKATKNMTEGIIRFLRGEFNTTFLREFRDTINTIGDNSTMARQFIPTHMGIGNIGIESTGQIAENLTSFNTIYEPSYSDKDLRSEILPYYNQHRVKIQKSTKGDSALSDTYALTIQGYYQFNQKSSLDPTLVDQHNDQLAPENPFKFCYKNDRQLEVPQFIEPSSGLKCITVTELGLYSGDVDDSGSRLLARLLLDPETPILLTSDDTMIINWQIGLYSLNDMLMDRSADDYKYQTITMSDGVSWVDL